MKCTRCACPTASPPSISCIAPRFSYSTKTKSRLLLMLWGRNKWNNQLNNYYFKYLFMPINKSCHYLHLFHFILVRQTQSFCNIIPELLEVLEVHHDVNSLVVMRICWWSQIQLQGHCWLNQSVWKCVYFFDESSPASHWHSSHCPAQHPPGNSSQRATITYIHYLSN